MRTTQPRPLTGAPPCGPPPVDDIDGRAVAWQGWQPTGYPGRHMPACTKCGYRGTQWVSRGRVDPLPGEQFIEVRAVSWRRNPEGVVRYPVAAWPTLRLVAHHCPTCYHRRVFDIKGGAWTAVALDMASEQLDLFPDLPAQRKA